MERLEGEATLVTFPRATSGQCLRSRHQSFFVMVPTRAASTVAVRRAPGPGEVSSSNFRRFDRNLNTGGNSYDESQQYPSRVTITVVKPRRQTSEARRRSAHSPYQRQTRVNGIRVGGRSPSLKRRASSALFTAPR